MFFCAERCNAFAVFILFGAVESLSFTCVRKRIHALYKQWEAKQLRGVDKSYTLSADKWDIEAVTSQCNAALREEKAGVEWERTRSRPEAVGHLSSAAAPTFERRVSQLVTVNAVAVTLNSCLVLCCLFLFDALRFVSFTTRKLLWTMHLVLFVALLYLVLPSAFVLVTCLSSLRSTLPWCRLDVFTRSKRLLHM